jgi:hypothetical protein
METRSLACPPYPFLCVHWVAVPKALHARRVNTLLLLSEQAEVAAELEMGQHAAERAQQLSREAAEATRRGVEGRRRHAGRA